MGFPPVRACWRGGLADHKRSHQGQHMSDLYPDIFHQNLSHRSDDRVYPYHRLGPSEHSGRLPYLHTNFAIVDADS